MSLIELTDLERRQLLQLLHDTQDAHVYRRTLAILLVDQDEPVEQVAATLDANRGNIYRWIDAFASQRDPGILMDQPRPGRPAHWGPKQQSMLLALLTKSPQTLGYSATQWTVPLLSRHLKSRGAGACSCSTLRRQLDLLDWSWKRARHVLEPDPQKEKKTLYSRQAHAPAAAQRRALRR